MFLSRSGICATTPVRSHFYRMARSGASATPDAQPASSPRSTRPPSRARKHRVRISHLVAFVVGWSLDIQKNGNDGDSQGEVASGELFSIR